MPGPAIRSTAALVERHRGLTRIAAATLIVGSLALSAADAAGAEAWKAWHFGAAEVLEPSEVEPSDAEGHLLISEVMAGGASASDEFVEIYNPTATTLPLEGLELIYVSASGATVTRKGEWPAGAPGIPPGAHLLVANEAGAFASLADLTYANGLATTGGSVALRIRDATTAIDAVGWGTAASAWLEGSPAPAVAAGHSLERLPGGPAGSGQDTDQNLADFVDRAAPDPQNAASPPIAVSPSAQPSPTSTPTEPPTSAPSSSPTPTPTPASPDPTPMPSTTPTPSPTPPPTPSPTLALTIAAARALPDGSIATVEGMSLTGSAFTDGGGYLADATGGIAVLVPDGAFPRGQVVRITGELDDRFHQRTLRAEASGIVVIGRGEDPEAVMVETGSIGEGVEGQLVEVTATIVSSATALSGAVAFDVDDGSGPARLVVLDAAGIDHAGWARGTTLRLRGVVGQRDSSGTGTAGYRLQPRDEVDVISVAAPSPTPSATPSGGGSASPTPSDEPGVVSIATARETPLNASLRVRGVVTLPASVLDDGTAAIQDGSGAIILRLGDEAGDVTLGEIVVVDGRRSTKSGMETLLVSVPPERRGRQAQPAASRHPTGSLGEEHEALLVTVRGAVATAPRRSSAQNVYFDLDDGSGPLRVYISPRTGIDVTSIALGATLELTGVLGQETSGQQPQRGYRLWPRRSDDVRVLASAGTPANSDPVAGSVAGGGTQGTGGTGPLGIPTAGPPTRAPDLAVPRLRASRLPRPEPSITPGPRAGGPAGMRPTSGDAGRDVAPWLALAAALLAATGALAATRPGLLDRVRRALARPAAETPNDDGRGPSAPRDIGAERHSPVERAVARLVPLPVVDDTRPADPAPSTRSRSRVRRILPPT